MITSSPLYIFELMNYKHIFFDLDDTLWDFRRNSKETLLELFEHYNLAEAGKEVIDQQEFLTRYYAINQELWKQYRENNIDHQTLRMVRFERIFTQFEIDMPHQLVKQFSDDYLDMAPTKSHLCDHAQELLDYLKGKYELHIITNGFSDIQLVKITSAKLGDYFNVVVTSGCTGYKKPSTQIFEYALRQAGAKTQESIMIGDSLEADIAGAKNSALDHVFYNPLQKAHKEEVYKEITSLKELIEMF